jgi:hypothetical protein
MLYKLIKEKAEWLMAKQQQHCRTINIVLLVLLIICIL